MGKDMLTRCRCGVSVWVRSVRGRERAFENDRFGHKRMEHICSGGKSFAASIADDNADLLRAAPWLKEEGK